MTMTATMTAIRPATTTRRSSIRSCTRPRIGATDIHLVRGVAPRLPVNGEIRWRSWNHRRSRAPPTAGRADGGAPSQILEEKWQLCFRAHWARRRPLPPSVYYHGGVPEMAIRVFRAHGPSARRAAPPPIVDRAHAQAERPGPHHRPDRRRKDDHPQLHDRPDQRAPLQDRDARGPCRVHHETAAVSSSNRRSTQTPPTSGRPSSTSCARIPMSSGGRDGAISTPSQRR